MLMNGPVLPLAPRPRLFQGTTPFVGVPSLWDFMREEWLVFSPVLSTHNQDSSQVKGRSLKHCHAVFSGM